MRSAPRNACGFDKLFKRLRAVGRLEHIQQVESLVNTAIRWEIWQARIHLYDSLDNRQHAG